MTMSSIATQTMFALASSTYTMDTEHLTQQKCAHNSHQHRERVKSEHNARACRSDRNTDSRPTLSTTPEPQDPSDQHTQRSESVSLAPAIVCRADVQSALETCQGE